MHSSAMMEALKARKGKGMGVTIIVDPKEEEVKKTTDAAPEPKGGMIEEDGVESADGNDEMEMNAKHPEEAPLNPEETKGLDAELLAKLSDYDKQRLMESTPQDIMGWIRKQALERQSK